MSTHSNHLTNVTSKQRISQRIIDSLKFPKISVNRKEPEYSGRSFLEFSLSNLKKAIKK